MRHWFHKFKPIAAVNRNQPAYIDPANPVLGLMKDAFLPKTDVLYRCDCGKLKTVAIAGTWTVDQVRGELTGERTRKESKIK